MDTIKLEYIGMDSCNRPVYKDKNERLFVDTDSRKDRIPSICTKYNNTFDGEPDTPIKYIEKYKDLVIEFVPERIVE